MMFDTTLLRTFHAVVQDCSFTRAASRLSLAQSAVSPLNRSAFTPQMQAPGPRSGLPALPDVEFASYLRVQEGPP